jgi:pyruvate dehydrogenase E2 component (dihydrolipoamide acetyltransferase)
MARVIRMPLLSDSMEAGRIVAWHKKVGDAVKVGETIYEVETDKTTMEQDSDTDGFILYVGAQEGESVKVNDKILVIIGKAGEDISAILAKDGGVTSAPSEAVSTSTAAPTVPSLQTQVVANQTTGDSRIKASPIARNIARQEGIDIVQIDGTGPNGRVIKEDVEKYLKINPTSTPQPATVNTPTPITAHTADREVPVSGMRATIARRLSESMYTAPHFYLCLEVNMDNAIATRKRINDMIAPAKISFNDLIVKAVASSLRQHPAINSSWLGNTIRFNHNINIGVAVAVPDGLFVPVIRNADQKGLTQINTETNELAAKAKSGKILPTDMQGNTFTISNLGMMGIEEFTAIINPPDACILAVGAIIEKPIVQNGSIVVGNQLRLTLSCDHRAVDGATGAAFLTTLKSILEDPIRMIV